MSGPEETDHAVVRVKGVEICLAWKQFGGGGDGCYPVSEEAAGAATGSAPARCGATSARSSFGFIKFQFAGGAGG